MVIVGGQVFLRILSSGFAWISRFSVFIAFIFGLVLVWRALSFCVSQRGLRMCFFGLLDLCGVGSRLGYDVFNVRRSCFFVVLSLPLFDNLFEGRP